VNFVLNARVSAATPEGVALQDGKFIKGGTIICTVGSSSAPLVDRLGLQKRQRAVADRTGHARAGAKNVWGGWRLRLRR